MTKPKSTVAVIFLSRRNDHDTEGYAVASDAMVAEAARQPGYLGIDSVRGDDGEGITISWWADEAAAGVAREPRSSRDPGDGAE